MSEKRSIKSCEKPSFSAPVIVHTEDVDVTGIVENRNGQYTVVRFTVNVLRPVSKFLARRRGMFQLNLRTDASGTFPDEFSVELPVTIHLRSYLSDDFKQLNVNLCKCRVSCDGIFGNIVVKDGWYMPRQYRERQKRKLIGASIREQIRAERRKPGGRTVYSHNNAGKPFAGGGVSPR